MSEIWLGRCWEKKNTSEIFGLKQSLDIFVDVNHFIKGKMEILS